MCTKTRSNAIETKIIATLTDEWQGASDICSGIYGPGLDIAERVAAQQALYYHFRNLAAAKLIERDKRVVGTRRLNFYRRLQT